MKFSITILLTISSLFFIQPTQSTFPIPGLIEHVCRSTPHYHLCVLTLKSHAIARKITSETDFSAFAKITLEVIAKKTPVILATLHTVHQQCESPEFKIALEGCINSYTKISTDILPKALGCLDKGDLDGVLQHALNIADLAASCQKKCIAFTGSSLSAFANAGSTQTGSSSTGSTGSAKTGSSAAGSINTGSSSAGSINTGSSAAGSINTGSGSASAGSSKSGSSSAGSINTGTGSASAGSSKTGSSSAGSINTGSGSASAGSSKTGSSSASTGTGSASAVKPAVKAAAKAVEESNVYVQNMCAITVSIVTKVSASVSKQTTLS